MLRVPGWAAAFADYSAGLRDAGFDVVLCAGQSNMAGRCTVDAFADYLDGTVNQWAAYPTDTATYQKIGSLTEPMKGADGTLAGGRTGPGPWFARAYGRMLQSGRRLLIINTAVGGTALVGGPWAVGGSYYSNSVTQANAAIAAAKAMHPSSRFVGICWIQGESDGEASVSTATYRAGLEAVVSGFRAAITGAADSWFVIGGMVPEAVSTRAGYPAIQAAHLEVAASTARCAYVAGVSGYSSDGLHYTNRPGPQIMGYRMADAARTLSQSTVTTPASATALTIAGPVTATVNTASTEFSVTANGALTGDRVVTPTATIAGTFSPTSVTLGPSALTGTFTFTPTVTGAGTISVTNTGGLANPTAVTFVSLAGVTPATSVTLTGPTSGTVGSATSNFTAGANGAITSSTVVTPSDGGDGGTFTPTSVTISSGSPTGTFTYTPASAGAKTISVTNNGGLSNPASISLTATAPEGAGLVYRFTSDTVGQAPVGVTSSAGGEMVVVNSGMSGWTGQYVQAAAAASPAGTYTSDFTTLVPTTATQTLTWKRGKSANGARDGFTLRSQPGTNGQVGAAFPSNTRQGYFFQVSDIFTGQATLRIYRFDAGSLSSLNQTNATVPSDAIYRASCAGSTLTLDYSTDGGATWQPGATATDTTYETGLGAIQYLSGFSAGNQATVYMDDITLTS